MTDWSLAGMKSWVTRRANIKKAVQSEAGRKAAKTKKRKIAANKAWETRHKAAL